MSQFKKSLDEYEIIHPKVTNTMTNKIKLLLTLIGFLISLYQIKAENAIALCPTGGGSFCSGGSTTIGLSRIDNFFYPLLKVVVFRFDTSEVILLPTLN